MKKIKEISTLWLAAAVAIVGFAIPATAQINSLSPNPLTEKPRSSGAAKNTRTSQLGAITVTHSSSTAIVSANSVSCNDQGLHTDNSYWRAFNLTDFNITDPFNVKGVTIGVERADSTNPTQPVTVNLYETTSGTFPSGPRTLIGTTTVQVAPQMETLLPIPVAGRVSGGAELVVEIFTPEGQTDGNSFFIGSNADPETGPSYLSAPDCGVTDPTTTDAIGFGDMHIVMIVNGNTFAPIDPLFDYDGDGITDIGVFRPMADPMMADFFVHQSTDSSVTGLSLGLPGDMAADGDFTGDGICDHAVFRPASTNSLAGGAGGGTFYYVSSSDGTLTVQDFGQPGDIPTIGDWDGDGIDDVSVYRPGAQGIFFFRGSSNNPNGNISYLPWGTTGDMPVLVDIDGDGRLDPAIFRPSEGNWWILRSSDGQLVGINFGQAGDKLVPADYDGDSITDLAVFRDGVWYIFRSSDGMVEMINFGLATDIPVPGNYDGDNRVDIAVFRDGVWYIRRSSDGGTTVEAFGQAGDMPLPATRTMD